MKKFVIIVIVLLLLAGGGATWWYKTTKANADDTPPAPTSAKVVRQNLRVSVDAYGAVSSNQDVDIKCQASGVVVELPYMDVGKEVKPGALLMKLDPKDEKPPLDLANAVVDGDESKVRAADVNCDIAKNMLENTQQQDDANLATTKATLEDARNKAGRTKELFEQKLASQEDLETANTTVSTAEGAYKSAQIAIDELPQSKATVALRNEDLRQAKAQLAQDQSRAATAQQNLDYCTVNAPPATDPKDPPDWYVSAMGLNLNLGYLVQSGSSGFSGGTTVMTLSDLSHTFVLATVDESSFGLVEQAFNSGEELPVILTADAFRNVQFFGKVVRIQVKGLTTSNVTTFEVKIEVVSANRSLLRPGMTANITMILGHRDNCLVIPVQAVPQAHADIDDAIAEHVGTESPATSETATSKPGDKKSGEKKLLQVNATMPNLGPKDATVEVEKPDGSTEERDVVLGLTDGTVFEVVSGLAEGDTVKLKKFGTDSRWHGDPNKKPGASRQPKG